MGRSGGWSEETDLICWPRSKIAIKLHPHHLNGVGVASLDAFEEGRMIDRK